MRPLVFATDMTAQSHRPGVYRVGTLNTAAPVADNSPFGVGLVSGLAQHGYRLDKNLMFERRGAETQMDRLPRLVDELVASKVDVIVAFGYPCAAANTLRPPRCCCGLKLDIARGKEVWSE